MRRMLRQERDPAGALTAREAGHGRALQEQRAVLGRQEAAADTRQRALSGRVGSDDAHHFAARNRDRDARDGLEGGLGMPVPQLAAVQQRHRRLRIRRTNSGAPTMAVTAPTGGSAPRPRKSTRASASARMRNAAPPSADAGSTTRWSGPVSRRTACGTIRPTKPTRPVKATAIPTAALAAKKANSRVRPTSTPSAAAPSSPSASRLSRPASATRARAGTSSAMPAEASSAAAIAPATAASCAGSTPTKDAADDAATPTAVPEATVTTAVLMAAPPESPKTNGSAS